VLKATSSMRSETIAYFQREFAYYWLQFIVRVER
jgi:hypothetical protein